MQGMIS